jgi:hypothetical protein
MSPYINKFIDYIENIYSTINIHRAIIIVNNDYEASILYDCLTKNNHTPIIVDNNHNINYDYRLFIISDINNLKNFNKNLYNFIAVY